MRIKQNFENYIDTYMSERLWKNFETEHYIFSYFSDSVASSEIEVIAKRQEEAFDNIISELGLTNPNQKIHYYLYPSEDKKKELMGDDGYAQAIFHDFSIHAVYTDEIKSIGEHEDTHLLTLPWGLSVGFLQEGLAEYMNGTIWQKQDSDIFVKMALEKNGIPSIASMMSHNFWVQHSDEHTEYYYPFAGSFVRFLFKEYGKKVFERLYKKTNRESTQKENMEVFEYVYGASTESVEKKWRNDL